MAMKVIFILSLCPYLASAQGDLCVDADAIALDTAHTGDTTSFNGDPENNYCGNSNSPGVWYSLETSAGERYTAATCDGSSYDTRLSVYRGTCGSQDTLSCVGYNDDACGLRSRVTWDAEGGTYYILVHGYSSRAGAFTLTVNQLTSPDQEGGHANDWCEDGYEVETDEPVEGNTSYSLETPYTTDPENNLCGGSNAPGVWYSLVTHPDSTYTASLCDSAYDTRLSVFEGECGSLTCTGYNDDSSNSNAPYRCDSSSLHSTMSWAGNGGTSHILVHGYSTSSGNYHLLVTCDGQCAVSAKGDPHLKNIKGESFDVMQTGNMVLLEFPRGSTAENVDLAVRADIDRMELVQCGPTFITRVYMTGRWLGAPVDVKAGTSTSKLPLIRLNKKEWEAHADFEKRTEGKMELSESASIATGDRTFALKVSTLDIKVKQPRRPRSFLDVKISGIGSLHSEIGGLLGVDDHSEVEELPSECQLTGNFHAKHSEAAAELEWSASISL